MDPWFRRWKAKMECLRIRNDMIRKMIAEYLGTFILVIFHNGSIAQVTLSRGSFGDAFSTHWGATIGLCIGIHWGWSVSGGHLNPAVSLGFAVVGKLPMRHVPFYAIAQCFGAFTGSVIIFGVYNDALNAFDGGKRRIKDNDYTTAGIFTTYPQSYLTLQGGFFDQVGAFNQIRWGMNHGYAVNPAKDFSQRLFTAVAGWGSEVWTPYGVHWWWIPVAGPLVGAPIGAWTYYWLIEFQHPPIEDDIASGVVPNPMVVMASKEKTSDKPEENDTHL